MNSDFQVTLPSNVSNSLFPQNKPSNYKTRLAKPLQLDENWGVALIDIQVPHAFKYFPDEARIWFAIESEEITKQEFDGAFTIATHPRAEKEKAHLRSHILHIINQLTPGKNILHIYGTQLVSQNIDSIKSLGQAICQDFNELLSEASEAKIKARSGDLLLHYRYDKLMNSSMFWGKNPKDLTIYTNKKELFTWLGFRPKETTLHVIGKHARHVVLIYITEALAGAATSSNPYLITYDADDTDTLKELKQNFPRPSQGSHDGAFKSWKNRKFGDNIKAVVSLRAIRIETIYDSRIMAYRHLQKEFYGHSKMRDWQRGLITDGDEYGIHIKKWESMQFDIEEIGIGPEKKIKIKGPVAIAVLGSMAPEELDVFGFEQLNDIAHWSPKPGLLCSTALPIQPPSRISPPQVREELALYSINMTESISVFENNAQAIIADMQPTWPEIGPTYVYSDIIEYQMVGDTEAQLLGVFPFDTSGRLGQESVAHGARSLYWAFNPPHYLRVKNKNIEEIEIQLCSGTGELLPLTGGAVVARLHFRRFPSSHWTPY